ncbi:MAG TPA: C1 family peptidase [Microbacteriaceae bacterium]
MPISDIAQLRAVIADKNLAWRVRAVPATEVHSLGADQPLPELGVRAALSLGTDLFAQLRAENPGVLLNSKLRISDIWKYVRLRPTAFDWRDRGIIGPVTNQGYCGSCVSFATAGLVAAQAAIELGTMALDLSEADQHFCSSHGAHCGGWNNQDSLDQVRSRGIATEASFPYMTAFDNPPKPSNPSDPKSLWAAYCRSEPSRRAYRITNFTAHTGDDRKTYLSTVGPMICSFTVYEDFDNYGGGAYRHATGAVRGGHAVLVVGYDDGTGTWICRNSWGSAFGGGAQADGTGGGYFRIAYGDSNIDGAPFYGCRGVIAPRLIPIQFDPRKYKLDERFILR